MKRAIATLAVLPLLLSGTQAIASDISVELNGNIVNFDQTPLIKDDRTLVPIRAIFEAMGYDVEWDDTTKTASATKGDDYIKVSVGNAEIDYSLAGKSGSFTCDVPAQIISERILVPIRAISECAGYNVEWDGEKQMVMITDKYGNSFSFSFRSGADSIDLNYNIDYSDSMFDTDTHTYSPAISVTAMKLAMAAFSSYSDKGYNANIEDLYSSLGFTDAIYKNYDVPLTDTSDKVAFSIAKKKADNGTIVIAAIRGGGYGGEWASNFNVGDGIYHEGFYSAASEVSQSLIDYVKDIPNAKILVTGFSRGGAVANITSANLINNGNTVFGYTFAAPNWIKTSDDTTYKNDYSSIFNILSEADLVPQIPLKQWGFSLLGNNVTLGGNDTDSVKEIFTTITGRSELAPAVDLVNNTNLMRSFIKIFELCAPNSDAYVANLQQKFIDAYSSGDVGMSKLIDVLTSSIQSPAAKELISKLDGNIINSIPSAHYPEVYLSWLESQLQ